MVRIQGVLRHASHFFFSCHIKSNYRRLAYNRHCWAQGPLYFFDGKRPAGSHLVLALPVNFRISPLSYLACRASLHGHGACVVQHMPCQRWLSGAKRRGSYFFLLS